MIRGNASPAVQRVVSAVLVYGPHPPTHRAEMRRLRRDWPVLANALAVLIRENGHPVPPELEGS